MATQPEEFRERLKQKNIARWQLLADKCLATGSQCVTCKGPLDLWPEDKEQYAYNPMYRPTKPTMCKTCLDMLEVLSHRIYWINLEGEDARKRRAMGLEGPQSA